MSIVQIRAIVKPICYNFDSKRTMNVLKIPMALHVNMGVLFSDFDSDDNYRVFYSVEYKSPRLKSYIAVSCYLFFTFLICRNQLQLLASIWDKFNFANILVSFRESALQNIFTIFSHLRRLWPDIHTDCDNCERVFQHFPTFSLRADDMSTEKCGYYNPP